VAQNLRRMLDRGHVREQALPGGATGYRIADDPPGARCERPPTARPAPSRVPDFVTKRPTSACVGRNGRQTDAKSEETWTCPCRPNSRQSPANQRN
jgi:hypothetical protein